MINNKNKSFKMVLNFSEWSKINEQDQLPQKVRAEGGGAGSQSNMTPDQIKRTVSEYTTPIKLKGNLFVTGSSKINTDSQEFKNTLEKILFLASTGKGPVKIEVGGGASAVGSDRGFDNAKLANTRRDNFIAAIKPQLGEFAGAVTFTPMEGIVGTAKAKGPEADAEQFVQITYPERATMIKQNYTTARETSSTGSKTFQNIPDSPKPGESESNKYMIVKIWYDPNKVTKDEFKKKILSATQSPAHELKNYADAAKLIFNP